LLKANLLGNKNVSRVGPTRRHDSSSPSCFGAPNCLRRSPAFSTSSEASQRSGCSFGYRLRRGERIGGSGPTPGLTARPTNRQTSERWRAAVVSDIVALLVVVAVEVVVVDVAVVVAADVVASEAESMLTTLADRMIASVSFSARCSPSRWPLVAASGSTARTSARASGSRATI